MKAIAFFALSVVAASAYATHPTPPGGGTQSCTSCPEINVNAPSMQVTTVSHGAVKNDAVNGGSAQQNLATNAGNVNINDLSIQIVDITHAAITNKADGYNAVAKQSLATNVGKVNINDPSLQVVAGRYASYHNFANSNSRAIQNVSTNNGCQTCN